jgi:hypothetical protein
MNIDDFDYHHLKRKIILNASKMKHNIHKFSYIFVNKLLVA